MLSRLVFSIGKCVRLPQTCGAGHDGETNGFAVKGGAPRTAQ